MKREHTILLAGLGAVLLTACSEPSVRITKRSEEPRNAGVLKVVETLTCPETVGALTRKSVTSEGGQVCTYAGPRGAQVTLHMVRLDDASPDAALTSFEEGLQRLMPQAAARVLQPTPEPPEPPATPDGPAEPGDDEAVDIRLPGLSISTQGDDAEVRMPGVSVSAREGGSRVDVAGVRVRNDGAGHSVTLGGGDGSVSIQSRDDVSEVRVHSGGSATRITYVLSAAEPSAQGWRSVGYEARGPQAGPLVVATVASKDRESDPVFDDAKRLVTLNVGE